MRGQIAEYAMTSSLAGPAEEGETDVWSSDVIG